jgi:GcrA cell cycle regulator
MLWSETERNHDMEWSDDMIARLRGLWAEGHSTAEIGRRMGVSKNAIIGKAHRLALPGRPSPIRLERPAGLARRRAASRRIVGPTLPPLGSEPIAGPAGAIPALSPAMGAGTARPAMILPVGQVGHAATYPAVRVKPLPARDPRTVGFPRYARQIPCCWPIGEPGTPSFRFCDDIAMPGKPYCEQHAQVAYVRVKDQREDAA